MAFFGVLSVQLIYSTMVGEIDSRTYELGMLRALGFKKKNVLVVLVIQGLIMAIPGLGLGIGFASIINAMMREVLFTISMNRTQHYLSGSSVLLGCIMGLIVPLVSNIYPIKTALGRKLRSALDMSRRSSGELLVTITKLEDLGISLPQLILSATLVVLGFLCYYVAPTSFFE